MKFKASDGWVNYFMANNGFSFRRITNLTSLSPDELVRRAKCYMEYLQTAIQNGLVLQNTILMDETAVYLEDPRRITVNAAGRRHVSLRSTGFASMRNTILLAVTASGKKLRPVIIHKKTGESGCHFELKNGCYICYNEKAWVNGELIKKWIDLAFPPVSAANGKALVWDSCRAHIANTVKEYMKRRGINNIVIPGGLTPYVQAGDLGIYKSFQDKISPIIAAWKQSDEVERTRGNNPKPPKIETIIKWVMSAWNQVNESVILNSVKGAGFGDETTWHIYKHTCTGQHFEMHGFLENLLNKRKILPLTKYRKTRP